MSTDTIQPKAIYEPVTKLEAFYTGGAVRVTRDRKHLACACGDEVKVLDVATGTVAKTLPGDSEPITAVAVSPDCSSLVAASRSLSVKHWDWSSGECRRTWRPHRAPIADLAIDASGGYLASGSADRAIKVTDLAGGYVTHHFTGHGGIVLKVLFHPKQLLLFSACDDGEVRIWDLVTKSCVHTLKGGHISAVPALSLSPDGWHLLSGGRDKVVCVWDIRSGSRVSTVPVFEALEGVAVLPMGSAFPGVAAADAAAAAASSKAGAKKPLVFATAGERGILRIWRSDTGTCVYTHHSSSSGLLQQGPGKGKKSAAAAAAAADAAAAPGSEFVELLLLPGGKGLMAATGDARLMFYHPQAGAEGPCLQLSRQLIGNHDEITDLTFLYTGSSSNSSTTEDTAQAAAAAAGGDTAAAGGWVLRPGEPRRLAVATNSHDIRLFDLSDASCVGSCIGHKDIVLCLDTVRASEGVELLASGAKDCEVRVWDPATGGCLAVAAGHVGAVTAIAWSKAKAKAGRYLASGGADKLLKLWDTSTLVAAAGAAEQSQQQQQLSTIAAVAPHEKDVNALAFSPNDALLASASQDRTIKLWKLPNLVLSHTLRGHKRGVWDLQFSPVDQLLLSCSGDKLVKMWSVGEGTCLRTFEGHTAGVLRCSFLTAGAQVLSAGADGLLKLWDSRTGVNTATFEGHEDRVWGLAASTPPAEALLASGGGDSQIVIWRDATAEKAAEAEAAEESLVLKQQELSNALADGDYAAAARLAFQLRHPGRLLDVLRRQPGGPTAALTALQSLVGRLGQDELATALSYCREWNTNTRNAHLAQVLLQAVLRSHTPEQILEVPGARELLDGLLAYSQRHSARLDRLMRSTFLLDYTLAASQVLLPENMHDEQQQQQQQQQNGHGLQVNGRSGDDLGSDDFEGWEQQQLDDTDDDDDVENLGDSDSEMDEEQIGHDSDAEASPQLKAAAAGKRAAAKADTAAAAPAAAVAEDYVDDGVQLPGWGGGDDLDDDWAADSSDQEGEASASEHGDSDGPDDVSDELGSGDAAGSGEGEGSENDSENGSENDSEAAAAEMGSDDSMGEGSSDTYEQEQPAVLMPVKQRSSGRQAAAAAAVKQQQRGGKQQKEQLPLRGQRQNDAAAAAVAAQEAGPGKKRKAAAAAAGAGSTAAQQGKLAKQRQRATRRA